MDGNDQTAKAGQLLASNSAPRPAMSGPNLFHIASRVIGRPLLLHPQKAEVLMHVLDGRLGMGGGNLAPPSPDANRFLGQPGGGKRDGPLAMVKDGVAIITIEGSLVNRGAWIGTDSGLVSYEGIAAQLRSVGNSADVRAVILDIDSPGGEATGMYAVAQLVAEVAKVKPVVAVVNDMAASAAYGIASAATEIVVSPTSMVGSIGVVLTHIDRSGELAAKGVKTTLIYAGAHKVDGHPFGPLSETVRADLQTEVAKFYDTFVGLVATGRGAKLTEDMVRATEARVFFGAEAVTRGLADRVASIDAVIADLKPSKPRGGAPKGGAKMTMSQAGGEEAIAAARVTGAQGVRARCAAILKAPSAKGKTRQALGLALTTELPPAEVAAVLAQLPPDATSGITDWAATMPAFHPDGPDAAVAESWRLKSILMAPEAVGKEALAETLALSGLPPADAIAMIARAAAARIIPTIAERAAGQPSFGPSGAGGPVEFGPVSGGPAADGWKKAIDRANAEVDRLNATRTGQMPNAGHNQEGGVVKGPFD
jgi:capsid assembly protease